MHKVVHLLRWCLPFTASFIRNQIIYHQRYQPSVVYTQPKQGDFFDDIHAKAATLFPLRSSFDRKLYEYTKHLSPTARKVVKDFIIQQEADVLHVHYGVDCLVYADLIRKMKIPTCVSFYGYDCTMFPRRIFGGGKILLKKKVFDNPFVNAVLAMSEDMKADLLKLGCPEKKIIVHYHGIQTEPFFMDRIVGEKKVIKFLIISGLFPKKGHAFLIDAFSEMSHPLDIKCELHIVGDGPMRQRIMKMIEVRNLSNIYLHDAVNYGSAEHIAYLQGADVFVHPSVIAANGDKEGIPGAVVEAMAAGLPVISTYHAGIPSIIENESTGLLVKEIDTKALQMAMIRLATDKASRVRIGQQGQKYALDHLDIVHKENELEHIYDFIRNQKQ